MARGKSSKFAWRNFFAASNQDIWTVIENAIQVASEDDVDELRRRRDGFVELVYRLSSDQVVDNRVDNAKALYYQKDDHTKQKEDLEEASVEHLGKEKIQANLTVGNEVKFNKTNSQCSLPLEQAAKCGKPDNDAVEKSNGKLPSRDTEVNGVAVAPDRDLYLNTEELEAVIEEDSLRIQKILQLRALLSMENKNEKELSEAISGLGEMNVTVEELKATEIGKTVSTLRKHPVKVIQSAAKHLVKLWMDMVDDFRTATEKISKKALEDPPVSEGGLQAPPLDAATLASRNTSADLSQLLDDFSAEDLAAGLEKLSSGVAVSPRAEDGRLAFLSPVYGGREAPRLDQPSQAELDRSVNERFADLEAAGLSLGETKSGEKWHQSERYADIRPEKLKTSPPESKEEAVSGRSILTHEKEKLKRTRDEGSPEREAGAKKARVIASLGEKKREAPPKESSHVANRKMSVSSGKDQPTGQVRNGESKQALDKPQSRTPELKTQSASGPISPSRPPLKPQPGTSQAATSPLKVPGAKPPAEQARSRTPELPNRTERPRPSPHSHKGEPQKPRSVNNFLDFSDAAKRATAPPRRAPEIRDKPGGPEKQAFGGGLKEKVVDDDFDLDALPASKSRKADSRDARSSSSEPDGGLAEEDGFLSDSDDEGGSLPSTTANKLEETKRRLHEKYMALENAKKSRTTVELKAGDIPARKRAAGPVDKSKTRGSLHSKLSKLMRK